MSRRFLMTFFILFSLISWGFLSVLSAQAATKPFIHPDFIYSHQLRQKYTVPSQINLNRASLEELKTLPGVDENLALKLIRLRNHRAFTSKRDLYELPFMEKREIDHLIQRIRTRIAF